MLLARPLCHIFEPNVARRSKSLPTSGLEAGAELNKMISIDIIVLFDVDHNFSHMLVYNSGIQKIVLKDKSPQKISTLELTPWSSSDMTHVNTLYCVHDHFDSVA